jgi:hypothetical protein
MDYRRYFFAKAVVGNNTGGESVPAGALLGEKMHCNAYALQLCTLCIIILDAKLQTHVSLCS